MMKSGYCVCLWTVSLQVLEHQLSFHDFTDVVGALGIKVTTFKVSIAATNLVEKMNALCLDRSKATKLKRWRLLGG